MQKSATVAFGEQLDGEVLRRAVDAAQTCQVFLAIGTSLTVQPAASLFDIALDAAASCVILNADPTIFDESAEVVVHASIGEVLPAMVASALA